MMDSNEDPVERVARQLAELRLRGEDQSLEYLPTVTMATTIFQNPQEIRGLSTNFYPTTPVFSRSSQQNRYVSPAFSSSYGSSSLSVSPQDAASVAMTTRQTPPPLLARPIVRSFPPAQHETTSTTSRVSSFTSNLAAITTPPISIAMQSVAMATGRGKPEITYRFCAFCKSNRERQQVYESHELKDAQGRVTCPSLFQFVCPHCGATGPYAHTESYCPRRPPGAPQSIAKMKINRKSCGNKPKK